MSPWITAVIVLIASLAGLGGFFILLSRSSGSATKALADESLKKISESDQQIAELLKSKDSYIGANQFDFIRKQAGEILASLEGERSRLKEIEQKLDGAQKLVETKEAQQQEIKSAKEEDLVKLQELLVNYEDISRESMELEQKLASSLKNLDSILTEVEMTQSQREMFLGLQSTVEEAGARLRDLLMEYQTVNERLNMLRQQHSDLEEEYTRLVEQQLGE
jgi:chromosome segregation ATPase